VSLLLDSGIVYAYYDRSDDWHVRARTLLRAEPHGLILPAPVIPEIDHLLGARLGDSSRLAFYSGITGGHFLVADLPRQVYGRVADINKQFADLSLGFVDAAIVILAGTLDVPRVATTDRRHFTPLAAHFSLELLP
jgi:predicted nucleic acid-binding protein